jgi:DNA-binding protein HU-beta
LNKAELIESIATKANASKAATAVLLNATLEVLSEALARGENVQLIGFGTFSVNERSARTGRNPQTGKEIKIAAKKVARFKAGTALSSALNKAKPSPAKALAPSRARPTRIRSSRPDAVGSDAPAPRSAMNGRLVFRAPS